MEKIQHNTSSKNWILPNESFPLYQLERRQLKWARTPEKARLWLRSISIVTIAILVLIWFVVIWNDPSNYDEWHFIYMYIIGIASLTVLSGILDFAAMVVTFSSLRNEKVLNRWDLLVLAADKQQITHSKHAFARLRIGRVLAFNLAVRIAVLIMLLLTVTIAGYYSEWGGLRIEDVIWEIQNNPLEFLIASILISLVSIFYLVEPIWRVKAVTAMGVALSGRITSISLLATAAFFTLSLMWILQAIILSIITYSLVWIGDSMWDFYYEFNNSDIAEWFGWLSVMIIPIIYLLVAYGFYRLLQWFAYKRIYAKIP
ncbi:MAG: hypothetical protein WBC91_02605 [Phototrophicaceae bacterium]